MNSNSDENKDEVAVFEMSDNVLPCGSVPSNHYGMMSNTLAQSVGTSRISADTASTAYIVCAHSL